MTDDCIPSINSDSHGYIVARTIEYAGGTHGWVQPSTSALLADHDTKLDQTQVPLDAFDATTSSSSLTVTIETGEALVGGAWLARDTATGVTLNASTTGQKVYVGWDHDASETVIIGRAGAFAADDPKIHIWTFDTDGSGVTNAIDKRQLSQGSDLGVVSLDDGSTFGRWFSDAVVGNPQGTAGNHNNEVFRVGGNTSDLIFAVSDGSGVFNLAYNAYFDGSWKYIVGSEPAYRFSFDAGTRWYTAPSGTADGTISWHEFRFDETAADLFVNTAQLWDGGNQHVPQGSLGGPASSLTSYPLPAGDIDDGSGSNLDADTLDGKHANELSGGQWTTIQTFSDTDGSTTMNWDSGTLTTTYTLYKVVLLYTNEDPDDNNEFHVRVNNDGTSNYESLVIRGDTGDFYEKSNKTAWLDVAKTFVGRYSGGEFIFRGETPPSGGTADREYPTMGTVMTHGEPHMHHFHVGELTSGYSVIDQIQFDSTRQASGDIKLLGQSL